MFFINCFKSCILGIRMYQRRECRNQGQIDLHRQMILFFVFFCRFFFFLSPVGPSVFDCIYVFWASSNMGLMAQNYFNVCVWVGECVCAFAICSCFCVHFFSLWSGGLVVFKEVGELLVCAPFQTAH